MKKPLRILIIAVIVVALVLLSKRLFAYGGWGISNIVDDLPRGPGSYSQRRLEQITTIVIHHSAWENGNPEKYARLHVDERGWPGIGYHYVIQSNGRVYQTNHLTSVSYHVENHNTPSVGICFSGDLDKHPPTPAQKRAVKQLIRDLKRKLPNLSAIAGHRDFKATGCPGKHTDVESLKKLL